MRDESFVVCVPCFVFFPKVEAGGFSFFLISRLVNAPLLPACLCSPNSL